MWLLAATIVVVLAVGVLACCVAVSRGAHIWGRDYLWVRARRRSLPVSTPIHVMFCLVDHFEPDVGGADEPTQTRRVQAWVEELPRALGNFHDSDGRSPVHTMFYPVENPRREHLEALRPLARAGLMEMEIHLHHDNDTPEHLRATLESAKTLLGSCGYLSHRRDDPATRFAFIHGNWALDNSRPDGRWCGVNNELQVLRATGCYADFTLPSAPSDTQTRTINSLYYATDDPLRPKSHARGIPVARSRPSTGDLLIVQGPLALNWRHRKWGLLPRLENAEISGDAPVTPSRIDNWVRQRIGVRGKPSWVFLKVHTHGCQERCADAVLGDGARRMHRWLQQQCNDGRNFILHYVTARELYNLIRAAEAGQSGNPNQFRDFELPPPPMRTRPDPAKSPA